MTELTFNEFFGALLGGVFQTTTIYSSRGGGAQVILEELAVLVTSSRHRVFDVHQRASFLAPFEVVDLYTVNRAALYIVSCASDSIKTGSARYEDVLVVETLLGEFGLFSMGRIVQTSLSAKHQLGIMVRKKYSTRIENVLEKVVH